MRAQTVSGTHGRTVIRRTAESLALLPDSPESFDALFADQRYEDLFVPWPSVNPGESDLRVHLRNRWNDWRNSNLYKYLRGFDAP